MSKVKKIISYDSYTKEHIKENFDGINNKISSHTPTFNKSDENLEDIKNNVDNCEEYEEENTNKAISVDTEKKVEFPAVIAHVEILTQVEYTPPVSEPLEITEPVEVNSFNPLKDNVIEDTILNNNSPKLFSIVRIMTQNGEKIGMCYTEEVGDYGTPIHNDLDFNSACCLVKDCSSQYCVDEFNVENDKIVGIIPMFMIPKKSKNNGISSTSYRPSL